MFALFTVESLNMTSDGLLVSKDFEGTTKVWNLVNGEEIIDFAKSSLRMCLVFEVLILLISWCLIRPSLNFTAICKCLGTGDLDKGLIRLRCYFGELAFNSVIGRFGAAVSLVSPIKVNGIDQYLVIVYDPSFNNLIALQTNFTVCNIIVNQLY